MPFQFVGKRTKSDSVVVLKHLRHMQLGGICSGLLVVRHLLPFLLVRALISFPLLHLAVLWELSSPNPFPRASDTSAQSQDGKHGRHMASSRGRSRCEAPCAPETGVFKAALGPASFFSAAPWTR